MPSFDLPRIRLGLYAALGFFQFLLFALCAARLNYTLHIPRRDTLNGGNAFYDPVVVDLLVNAIVGIAWAFYIFWVIYTRREQGLPVKTFRDELIGLGLLWFWLLVGTAYASDLWLVVPYCQEFEACRVISALLAFAWLSWVTLTILLGMTLLFSHTNGSWTHALHGHWNAGQGSSVTSSHMSQVGSSAA